MNNLNTTLITTHKLVNIVFVKKGKTSIAIRSTAVKKKELIANLIPLKPTQSPLHTITSINQEQIDNRDRHEHNTDNTAGKKNTKHREACIAITLVPAHISICADFKKY